VLGKRYFHAFNARLYYPGRNEAARHGLTKNEIDRMASAFEHEDLELPRTQDQGATTE
jgi:hypothetical protein